MDRWREVWADPRRRRYAFAGILLGDLALLLAALALAVAIGHGYDPPGGPAEFFQHYAAPLLLVGPVVLAWRKLHRINARYLGVYDLLNVGLVSFLLSLVVFAGDSAAARFSATPPKFAVVALFFFFSVAGLSLGRMYQRLVAHRALHISRLGGRLTRTLIVGAGDEGESLLRELGKLDPPEHQVVGLVDQDPALLGRTIHGIEVLGGLTDLPTILAAKDVDEVFVADTSASGEQLRQVFNACTETDAKVRTLPAMAGFIRGGKDVLPHLREVEVDDLLRRASVKTEVSRAARYISGERVLITGAGGSIGAELARQIVSLSPASLVLLGKGENSVFEIDQELRDLCGFQATPVIADVRDGQALSAVMERHSPSVVFHAAAHKHVPLMEAVPIEAVRNNVIGTRNVAECAVRNGVRRFILVSTDKAVNPKNVMGATKRVAEMIVAALARSSETNFSTVRFGNVLGSRGSLIPILKRQIRMGGPVTVTHPEMTRFFMTIPEAVQLIVEAGALGEQGEVFILDMGEPVSILELAKDMIRLHGLVPGKDVEVRFTGIRPGEKIHEELSYEQEGLLPSQHEKIMVARSVHAADWEMLRPQLDHLAELCDLGDEQAVRAFLLELSWGKTLPPIATTN
jgi:FlaA1/EpsC-like NDP-sugar epimerase